MSIHEAKVLKVTNIINHDNADTLEIIKIWDYDCIVKKGDFKIGDLVVYLEPDTVVPTTRSEFSFLAKKVGQGGITITQYINKRITVKRFRGKWSQGLLIKAPNGFREGDDCWSHFGLTRWEPAESNLVKGSGAGSLGSSMAEKGPNFHCPHYDLNNLRKFAKVLKPNETVMVTAKIHGTNGRFCYSNSKMFCGSRNTWKKKPGYYFTNPKSVLLMVVLTILKLVFKNNAEKVFNFMLGLPLRRLRGLNQHFTYFVSENAWWKAYKQNSWIKEYCEQNPDVVLYGEVYGPGIQGKNFHYGLKEDQVGFAVFDILENGGWINNKDLHLKEKYEPLKKVPFLYQGDFDMNKIAELAEMKETFNSADHVREGVVVKLLNEREDEHIGRVALKYVSNQYLEKE